MLRILQSDQMVSDLVTQTLFIAPDRVYFLTSPSFGAQKVFQPSSFELFQVDYRQLPLNRLIIPVNCSEVIGN